MLKFELKIKIILRDVSAQTLDKELIKEIKCLVVTFQ